MAYAGLEGRPGDAVRARPLARDHQPRPARARRRRAGARRVHGRRRCCCSAGGCCPSTSMSAIAGRDLSMDFSAWVVSGLMLVAGSTWLIVYNADLLLGATMRVAGRIRALAPVLKMAMAYPLRVRFRTGVTLAMFTLVVFTIVVGATTSRAFLRAVDDVERLRRRLRRHRPGRAHEPARRRRRRGAARGPVHVHRRRERDRAVGQDGAGRRPQARRATRCAASTTAS